MVLTRPLKRQMNFSSMGQLIYPPILDELCNKFFEGEISLLGDKCGILSGFSITVMHVVTCQDMHVLYLPYLISSYMLVYM